MVKEWNTLPHQIVTLATLKTFMMALRNSDIPNKMAKLPTLA
jgi:hypothetical protein